MVNKIILNKKKQKQQKHLIPKYTYSQNHTHCVTVLSYLSVSPASLAFLSFSIADEKAYETEKHSI